MATVIESGDGRYIIGDPVDKLGELEHWCYYCTGDGVITDYFYGDGLEICSSCWGSGAITCDDLECVEHAPVHGRS